jgi:hypothetical protein
MDNTQLMTLFFEALTQGDQPVITGGNIDWDGSTVTGFNLIIDKNELSREPVEVMFDSLTPDEIINLIGQLGASIRVSLETIFNYVDQDFIVTDYNGDMNDFKEHTLSNCFTVVTVVTEVHDNGTYITDITYTNLQEFSIRGLLGAKSIRNYLLEKMK